MGSNPGFLCLILVASIALVGLMVPLGDAMTGNQVQRVLRSDASISKALPNQCQGIVCATGFRCSLGRCVQAPMSCEEIRCASGTHCENGRCVQDTLTCDDVVCAQGAHCVESPPRCVVD